MFIPLQALTYPCPKWRQADVMLLLLSSFRLFPVVGIISPVGARHSKINIDELAQRFECKLRFTILY